MGFMDAIKSLFSPAGGSARRNPRAYIVDAARLVDEKTGRRLAPRDQVQILNALARVAKQENLDLQVVFESDRPLREVDHGGEYNGLKVFYAPDNEQLVAMALKLSRSADGALVSSGVTMESRATEAGIPVLCSSTFRKAFLQGGLPGGGERRDRSNGNGDRDRRRGRDRRRDRNDRGGSGEGKRAPREESQGSGPSESPSASSGTGEAPASPEDNSTVRNLIDLVE